MAVFVKKKTWPTRQKVFPLPTVRALSASNSPSALSAHALQARALHARAWWQLLGHNAVKVDNVTKAMLVSSNDSTQQLKAEAMSRFLSWNFIKLSSRIISRYEAEVLIIFLSWQDFEDIFWSRFWGFVSWNLVDLLKLHFFKILRLKFLQFCKLKLVRDIDDEF